MQLPAGENRDRWLHLRGHVANGIRHPKVRPGHPERWRPSDATPAGIERLLQTTLAISREELPADLEGTKIDPASMGALSARIARLFDILDEERANVDADQVRAFAVHAPLIVEPYLVKVLARVAPDELLELARGAVDLGRLLVRLHKKGFSPFEPSLLNLSTADFKGAVDGDGWSALSWCLWQLLGDRVKVAHAAPDVELAKAMETLWSTAAVLLSVAERTAAFFDPARGRLPARFRAVRPLGAGGMGEVFLAVDVLTDTKRAVKVLHHAQLDSVEARRSLLREATALSKISSARVVRYYDVVEFDGGIAMVMSLVEGETLQHDLDTTGPMPLADAVNTTIEVLSALEDIHLEGLVHRDIKPSNLIRTTTGIVVIDFGLARRPGDDLTQPQRGGTPRYIAPEQHEGKADQRSDLYAAGRVLYALVAGGPPSHDMDPLPTEYAAASPALASVYEKATQREPDDRYQSAAEMREALRLALEHREATVNEALPVGPAVGHCWGDYLIAHEVAKAPSKRWSLVRVRAQERRFARPKLLWVHHDLEPSERDELLDLGGILAEIQSEHVQRIDEIVDDPAIGLLFEDLPPTTLAGLLKRCADRGRRMPIPAAIRIARHVAEGLDAIERHLTPSLGSQAPDAPAGAREHALKSLARRLWPRAVRISPTATVTLSTVELLRDTFDREISLPTSLLRYQPPEQLGIEPAHARWAGQSRVYTVGLMLWECLVGSQAFTSNDPERLRREIIEQGPPGLSASNVIVPASLEALMVRALSRDPAERPSTPAELARALMDMEGLPLRSRQDLRALVAETESGV